MVELSGKSNERAGALANMETALRFPVGAFSPLWMMFAGAASAGVAYWWMARWAKPVNLEALLGARAPAPVLKPAPEPATEAAPEPAAILAVEGVANPDIDTETLESQAFAEVAQVEVAQVEVAPEGAVELALEPAIEPAAVAAAEPVVIEPASLEAAPARAEPKAMKKRSAKAAAPGAAKAP